MKSTTGYKILMVDDEPNILAGYARTVGRTFNLTVAEGGPAGLTAMSSAGPFAAVVTDMRMPGMTGLQFLEAARAAHKETVFMMLTGNADQQTAVDAINRGHIFRFLSKPCPPDQLDAAVKAALRQYELVTAERVLLRETFTGGIKLLAEVVETANPALAAFGADVKRFHAEVCDALGVVRDWQLTVSVTLCLIGLVTLPGLTVDEAVTDDALRRAATLGHRLISHLPRLEPVAAMILRQRDPAPLPPDLKSPSADAAEAVGSQLIRFCVDLARARRRCGSRPAALAELRRAGGHDPRLISALSAADTAPAEAGKFVLREVNAPDLLPGMELDGEIRRTDGALILSGGQRLTDLSVAIVRRYAEARLVAATIKVRVHEPPPAAAA